MSNKNSNLRWAGTSTIVSLLVALSGCVSQGVLIGDQPTEPAPKLAFLGAKDAKGQEYMTWENVSSFGRVPPQNQATGDLRCMRLGLEMRATGYHPKAQDTQSRLITGGGYFCEPLAVVPGYSKTPPKMMIVNGVMSWDKPGSFGPIPDQFLTKAQTHCKLTAKNAVALGYHPRALDQSGEQLPQGGFLCSE